MDIKPLKEQKPEKPEKPEKPIEPDQQPAAPTVEPEVAKPSTPETPPPLDGPSQVAVTPMIEEVEPLEKVEPLMDSVPDPALSPLATPEDPTDNDLPKKSKRGLIALIIAVVLVLLGIGAAVAYYLWYQSPNKVVADGIINVLKADTMGLAGKFEYDGTPKTTIEVAAKATNTAGSIDVKVTVDAGGKPVIVDAAGIYDDKGDLYVKAKNLDVTLKDQRELVPPAVAKKLDSFVAKVNDRWIKISADEIKQASPEAAKSQDCLRDAYTKIQADDAMTTEVHDLYVKHPFVSIKENLGSKDGNYGFVLEGNKTEATAFADGLKSTKAYALLSDCDKNFKVDADDLTASEADTTKMRVELWISQWQHEIASVVVTSEDTKTSAKSTLSLQTKFHLPVTIEAPEDSLSVDELMKEIQDLQAAFMPDESLYVQ